MRKTFLVLAAVALAMVVLGGVAWAANIQCRGEKGLLNRCNGTKKADTMQGTKYVDQMKGMSGADTMYGLGKVDYLLGGPGPDKMYGGQGSDRMFAGAGVDRLYSQGDFDIFYSGDTPDLQDGRQIDVTDDYYYGGAKHDEFGVGGTNGVDRVYGGTGDDHIFVAGNAATGAKEIVDCGPGTRDFVLFDEGVDVVMNCEFRNEAP
jgi:Ca2+-binding RTX toxin-like protein